MKIQFDRKGRKGKVMKTLKKRLSLFLLMIMIMTSLSPSTALANPESNGENHNVSIEKQDYDENDFTYNETFQNGKDCIAITGLSEQGKEKQKKNHVLNIPSAIHGKDVISIEKNAFSNLEQNKETQFTAVILPTKIQSIGESVFVGNALSEVVLPDRLESIGDNAFAFNELTGILIPSAVKKIGLRAFAENKIKQGDAKIDNIKGKVQLGFEAFGDVSPIYLKTAQKYNITVDAPKGINVSFTPASPVEEKTKVSIDYKITDETKELLDIKVKKKNGEVNITGNSFVMPKEDITIVVRLKDKYTQEKWSVDDFVFGTMKIKVIENGEQKEIELNAVNGFSDKGMEKIKTVKDLELPKVNNEGNIVEAINTGAFRGDIGKKRLETLKIPEGYKVIGSMAFAFNGCGGDLVLPESMEFVDSAAFFRNEFTGLTVPSKMTQITPSMMRGNKLKTIIFNGNIESIGRLAFAENRIEEIKVPDSLKSIGEQAFTSNMGLDDYDGKVVIRTSSGKNPNKLQAKENYLINPDASTPGQNPSINYKEWTTEDFEYSGSTVKGFSDQGRKKIRKNKNLVIPDKTPDGKAVKVIGIDAFRNMNYGYDIESVKLPDTVTEIEDYALQFNDIDKVKLPRDLKKLGMGVFMMSNVTKVEWNDKLEYIDQACFYMCELGKLNLPASVETVMNASFRKCALTEVNFAKNSKLKTIEAMAFADNKLNKINLPEGLEKIGQQAFGNNRFTELNVPGSVKEIGFQAFINNPGVEKYNAVVVHTPDGKNPNNLTDDEGKTFIVDAEKIADESDKMPLKKAIETAEKINTDNLTLSFGNFFKETLKEAKSAFADNNTSKSKVAKCIKSLKWAIKRSEISALMFEKEALDSKSATFDKNKWQAVEDAYKAAKRYLMTIDISDTKVQKVIKDLQVALKDLNAGGMLKGAKAYEGEAKIPKTHYIKPYTVKIKVWVKSGKIVYVRDNGTVCDDPNEEEQPNTGYYEHATEIMMHYIGKDVDSVLKNSLGKDLGIDAVTGATVSSDALHVAIKDALHKVKKTDSSSKADLNKLKSRLNKSGIKIKSVKAYKKYVKISWKKVPYANRYKLAYKKNKSKKWSYKTVKGTGAKIGKMSKKSCIEIKVAPVRVVGKQSVQGKYSKAKYFYMAKTKIRKLTAKNKKITVLLAKFSGADGYQIIYSKKASLKHAKYKTVKGKKILLKGLKKKTKYYFEVRCYKKLAGKKYFGGWSKIKHVRIK